ncbi:siroheme synthase [Thermocrinis albus DSM 14484]|uniref:precorrin-2 dehydrogenase n=1 Tax=Thermocrinis albus (strain DSM 14484 / JCM 11386 / HI 11/12) TaxID=638303 RepID=D3SN54_THEAH|nr:bifunctional precorrin-2 dehydrogenase/sirohydrochlorin ferrochelatase [Thermocrinis albus]ADC90184.1 siroheme synthase [Thermocrinis albus DSM 14484]
MYPYFPAFVSLEGRKVLVVGGGNVATRKVEKLLPFGPSITVVAPRISRELLSLAKEGKIRWMKRSFMSSDIKGAHMVIVAVDDERLQKKIFRMCERRKILCNCVDSPHLCNFLFPALILRGHLVVGVSTSGRVPALSSAIREFLERCIPENTQQLLEDLAQLRESMPPGEERQRFLREYVRKLLHRPEPSEES